MSARHIPCGIAVNESERQAIERLKTKLPNGWILFSNLTHSTSSAYPSDEIDLIIIGPPGITVVEVKHWDLDYVKKNPEISGGEADRANDKAKRIAGKIRRSFDPGYVAAKMLLTRGPTTIATGQRIKEVRGVRFFGLSEWKELANVEGGNLLSQSQIDQAAKLIEPRASVAVSGDLRRFGDLINLERLASVDAPFHRIYRGEHPSRRDKVVLHLFDLSATEEKQPENRARREFEVIQRWQKSYYVPSLLDSFQEADRYPGELFYFSLVDSAAPILSERAKDVNWGLGEKMHFAQEALSALSEFHNPSDKESTALIHRNINPETLRVRRNGRPLFTGFGLSRLTDAHTISIAGTLGLSSEWIAPEIRSGGLSVADARSDIFSLCKSLMILFDGQDSVAQEVREWLELGCLEKPESREKLANIVSALERIASPIRSDALPPPLPAPEFWDEDTVVPFKESHYRIVNRLGRGGIGQTFKVVEVGINNEERFGTYVAKVLHYEADAAPALNAYRKARQHTTHPNLSALHEIASEWQPNCFVALMKWIEGIPLADLTGVLELYLEELGEPRLEIMLLKWLDSLCDALWQFHQVGLVHGDVSPRNIIVQGGNVILTDYDTVTDFGQILRSQNAHYSSENIQNHKAITASDDLFSLSATFFHVLFERDPFAFGADRFKNRGLNWEGVDEKLYPKLRTFMDRATQVDVSRRFHDARDARVFLNEALVDELAVPSTLTKDVVSLTPQVALRLSELLSAYPGSRHGNVETRGLDSLFSERTYVDTGLDQTLQREVREGEVDLIILFGNAGDGKTAFLQNLAQTVVQDRPSSQERLWERRIQKNDGRMLKLNLDGSAAYKGKSANDLLDTFLAPFKSSGEQTKRPHTHALAINSGKMLEWLDLQEEETPFTEGLRDALFADESENAHPLNPRFRLVDLNHRSLVGGYDTEGGAVGTQFLNALLDRFLGNQIQDDPWASCLVCSAQARCCAWNSVRTLRDTTLGARVRSKLADALQACHLRGEIHITARELRAALVFILFGIHDCDELHKNPELVPAPYWDRAFAADGESGIGRQGELLSELAHFDPALDANPILDRHLLKRVGPKEDKSAGTLSSARRRAFFEWSDDELSALHLSPEALSMHGAKYLSRFRRVPVMSPQERSELCRDICLGIARLENLPEIAFRTKGLPLRVTPRTPTESSFWVLKEWDRFELSAPLPKTVRGLEVLHTKVLLTHRSLNGRDECLPIGLELFHLLLALKDGAQLMGASQEGVFAHLDLFVQRIAQEDVRELYGWHPEKDDEISRLQLKLQDGMQVLIRSELTI